MNVTLKTLAIGLATVMLPATAAFAATDAEQSQFVKDVEQKCAQATADTFKKPVVAVDPRGSANFGLAIVYGRSKELKGPGAVICVLDRKTQTVEIGSVMNKDVIRVRNPKAKGAMNKKAGSMQKGNVATDTNNEDQQ